MAVLPTRGRTPEVRRTAHERGYTARWRDAREAFIADQFANGNWSCAECGKPLMETSDIHVDHRIPHRGNPDLFWSTANWQMLHKKCHAAKTRRGE